MIRKMTIIKAVCLIKGPSLCLQQKKEIEKNVFSEYKTWARDVNIHMNFEIRQNKLEMHESLSIDNYRESAYWIDIKIINVLTSYLKYIYEKLNKMSSDFEFLSHKKVIFYKRHWFTKSSHWLCS